MDLSRPTSMPTKLLRLREVPSTVATLSNTPRRRDGRSSGASYDESLPSDNSIACCVRRLVSWKPPVLTFSLHSRRGPAAASVDAPCWLAR